MNSNARKNIIYSLVLLALVLAVYAYRSRQGKPVAEEAPKTESGKVVFSGKTMGTDYQITYLDEGGRNFQSSVDSLLKVFNQSISGYEPNSEVNLLNLRDTLLSPSATLLGVLEEANRLYDLTGGALDPTQQALEKIWNFSPSGAQLQDSTDVRLILSSVGFKKVILTDTLIRKTNSGVTLDFSKSGKGYAVDLIGAFLEAKGIKNFLIQIGGENLAKGLNENGELWKIGLFHLGDSLGKKGEGVVALQDKAISTAGNFEQFYIKDSVRVSYTLDPRTGYPVTHGLLGATVIGPDSKTADGLADALMVMGWREAIRLDSSRSDLELLLIYNEKGGKVKQYLSPELVRYVSFPVK
jgi:thiamine biosynthesis lipoprotein